jgi:hypothetical protein
MRARFVIAATLVAAGTIGLDLFAQTAQTPAPPMPSVLAGRKLTPPIRGEAALEFVDPKPERVKDMVITKMIVRNASAGPIARLTINETWYDKGGATVTAGRGSINGLLQPGEIATVTIETPWKAGMQGFQRQYAHANGSIKPVRVKQLEMPKPAADAKPAPETKKP